MRSAGCMDYVNPTKRPPRSISGAAAAFHSGDYRAKKKRDLFALVVHTSFESNSSFLSELSLLPCSRLFVLVSGTDIEPTFTMRGLSKPSPSDAHYDKLAREREEARRVNS